MHKPRLLEQVRNQLRLHQYSFDTERTYIYWIKRFIFFHELQHPKGMGKTEIEAFLTHLAVNRGVSPSTQNLALAAILFMYQRVLEIELPWLDDVIRAKPKQRVPVVLSTQEVQRLFQHCRPSRLLPVQLLYSCGFRLMECLRLRVDDLDFSRHTVRVHAGKGGKDWITVLTDSLINPLRRQIELVGTQHQQDLKLGYLARRST